MQPKPKIYDDFQAFQLAYQFDFTDKANKLGDGSYGEVIKGIDNERKLEDNQLPEGWVAIKRSFSENDRSIEREHESAKDLSHPNVMRYLAYGRLTAPHVGVRDYLVMPYYPDGNLHQFIRTNKLDTLQTRSLTRGILNGLAYLHSQKCQHRDLKGSNILIGRHPKTNELIPVIADFGSAKQVKQSNSESFSQSEHAKTIANAAPEQIRGESSVNYNVDLWAFGVILYEIMTGQHPFNYELDHLEQTTARKTLTSRIVTAALPEKSKTIAEPYQTMIRRCLVVDRKLRVQKAEDLLKILDTYRVAEPGTDPYVGENTISLTQEIYSRNSLAFIAIFGGPLALSFVYDQNLKVFYKDYKPSALWRYCFIWVGVWVVVSSFLMLTARSNPSLPFYFILIYGLMIVTNFGLIATVDRIISLDMMNEKIDSHTESGGSTFSVWGVILFSFLAICATFFILFLGIFFLINLLIRLNIFKISLFG